ncbi:MAG TPA: hypothetical protein VIV60_19930 [Polyangiaceae bacterium]
MRTSNQGTDRLYALMPTIYRELDATRGYPLRALLRIIETQSDLLELDIGQLWDDLFIETCRPWVIPYIGDLVGNRLLFDSSRVSDEPRREVVFPDLTGPDLRPPIAIRTRADVAKTIYYRRRKCTLPMLEELARDVTGWATHAVEFFELLGWDQHLEHVRMQCHWVEVRNVDRMDRIDAAFDTTTHTVDVRRIAQDEGWHNLHNVGLFLFRLGAYELRLAPARRASANWRYHFSPLGNPTPLFVRWRREGDEAGLATELHVPAPLRRPFYYEDLQRYRNHAPPRQDATDVYGRFPDASFAIFRNGTFVAPTANPNAPPSVFQPQIVCHQLDPWPASPPSGQIIAVDPANGRMAIGDGWPDATERIDVNFHYGFPANLGGGAYERQPFMLRPELASVHLFVQDGATPTADTFPTVLDAITDWEGRGRPNALVTLLDNRTYSLPAQITLPNAGFLVIEASNGVRPLLQTEPGGLLIDTLPPANPLDPTRESSLTLGGVVIEGHLRIIGDLGFLRLLHSTLVPGRRLTEDGNPATVEPSLLVDAGPAASPINTELRVQFAFSVTGALRVPDHAREVMVLDSIVDGLAASSVAYSAEGNAAGPNLRLDRSTLLGEVVARSLNMSESIVTSHLKN